MGDSLDLLEVHSTLLDQPQNKNRSALQQSGQVGPPNYRGQRTVVYDGLHRKREGGRARADRRAPNQTCNATQSFPAIRFDLLSVQEHISKSMDICPEKSE